MVDVNNLPENAIAETKNLNVGITLMEIDAGLQHGVRLQSDVGHQQKASPLVVLCCVPCHKRLWFKYTIFHMYLFIF